MSADLTEDQEELLKAAIEFGRASLRQDAEMIDADRDSEFDAEGWKKCAEFGLFRMPVPADFGGLGEGLPEVLAVMEGLGYATRDQGLLFSANAHLWTNTIPILMYGNERQKRKYLPPLSSGEWIGANASTEAEAGSDIFAMRTRAEWRDDRYILNGTKTFVTNAPVADLIVTYATIDPALGATGITAFLIERHTPGVSVGHQDSKMGLRTSPLADVVFEDCEISVEQRLGREGRGRRSLWVRYGMGAWLHPRELSGSNAPSTRASGPSRAVAQAIRKAHWQVSVGRESYRRYETALGDVSSADLSDWSPEATRPQRGNRGRAG